MRDIPTAKPFIRLLQRFGRDESGVFGVIFALMGIALVAFAGSVVDYTMFEKRRSSTQTALDAAALALQSEIRTTSKAKIAEKALAVLRSSVLEEEVDLEMSSVDIDEAQGSLTLTAKVTGPTYFVTLVGVHELGASVRSTATRKSQRIEIAMVLDNSGSMDDENRMAYLKQAATNATSIFFEGASQHDPNMFVGVVPFTQFVNVGTQNANATWIDRFGRSSIADDNMMIDPASPIQGFDRIALFSKMATERWRGCVEARVFPYDTNDETPTPAKPDTLFLPLLAPDEPDTQIPIMFFGRIIGYEHAFNNSYIADQRGQCAQPPKNQSWTERTLQERMCKYNGAPLTRPNSMTEARGPNVDCPTNALTPLSSNKSTVDAAIRAMSPQGGTNIAQGAVWGLHMLTPGLPLDQAEEDDQSVSKVMILMTDGDNFHAANSSMNGSRFYTAYGYPYNRRLGKPGDSTATLIDLMDERLMATCRNARAMGIDIYTIGLSVPSQSTKNMLRDCSNGEGYYFLPSKPSELDGIFATIADRLSVLRIAH